MSVQKFLTVHWIFYGDISIWSGSFTNKMSLNRLKSGILVSDTWSYLILNKRMVQTVPLINPQWVNGYRRINYYIQSWKSASLPARLCTFSPLFMLPEDWPIPSAVRVWESICVWKSFDSSSKGQGFSLTLSQITGRLTDEHSYAAKRADAVPLLASQFFLVRPPTGSPHTT